MLNGTYHHPTVFLFGREMETKVGEEVRKHGSRVLFHYGQGSIRKSGLHDGILSSLRAAGLETVELGGVEPNPKTGLVYRGIELCRKENIDFILAAGGGSVIDSAKAISVGVPYDGDFYDLFRQKAKPASALKVGVVLTIPGSGSESSCGTVISDTETKEKNVCDTPLLYPVFSILNPELTGTLSPDQTSCGIVDALTHVFERYFSNTEHVDCTDRICEGLMITLMKHGELVLDDPGDYDIRAEIMWASKLAHDATPGFGRKQDWGCHKVGHEIGAFYDLTHGRVMGVLFLAWFRLILGMNPGKLAQFGRRVFNVAAPDDRDAASAAISRYEEFLLKLRMPTTLRGLGIQDRDRFPVIARRAVRFMESGTIGNYVRLSPDDIVSLLEKAY